MLQKYQIDRQDKAALRESGMQNIFGGIGDIGAGAMQYGMFKGMGGLNQGTQGLQMMGSNPYLSQDILTGTGNRMGGLKMSPYQVPQLAQPFKFR
jgi:hypothetical protein